MLERGQGQAQLCDLSCTLGVSNILHHNHLEVVDFVELGLSPMWLGKKTMPFVNFKAKFFYQVNTDD